MNEKNRMTHRKKNDNSLDEKKSLFTDKTETNKKKMS